jgi:hypothetical protein
VPFVAGNGVAEEVELPASPPVPASLPNTGTASILSNNTETKIEILFRLSMYDGRDMMI